jgi:hypothetical protein
VLRQHFLTAEMGISGANFLIAETGSAALVTNEGNGRMVTTLPKVHVVITGIEKVIPTLEDFATLMRLLPRSATGQAISNYVSLLTGTRREAIRRPGKHGTSSWSTTAAPSCSARLPGHAALHPLRRLHEPLPGLFLARRPRLRLGLSRADGLGADAALYRHGKRPRPAARRHRLQPVRQRLPGAIPLPDLMHKLRENRSSAACARGPSAWRSRPGPGWPGARRCIAG